MPTSDKQLAANRANAAKSTGPRTPEGKARSSQNACTHRFTASTFAVVRLEEFDEIARLKHDLLAVYQPVNSQELFALEQMALAQQTMFRAAHLESGFFTTCLDHHINANDVPICPMSPILTADIRVTRAQNRNYALADGLDRMAKQGNSFVLLSATRPRPNASTAAPWRPSIVSKPCATNYQTKPFRTSNPKKTSRITCHRANPFQAKVGHTIRLPRWGRQSCRQAR